MKMLIDRLEPIIKISGTALQHTKYYMHICEMEVRRDRYLPNDLTLQHFQLGLTAAQEAGDLDLIGVQKFGMGFCHVWRMELNQAETCLTEALAIAERVGNMEQRVLCGSYLTIAYRRKKATDAVKVWAERCLALAREANMSFYYGIALGNLSWFSFMEGDLVQAEEYTRQARETGLNGPTMPMKIVYLWPLLAISLGKDCLDQANETAKEIIHPSQTRIPDSLETVLRSGIDLYDVGERDHSKECFERAVKMAIDTGYF